MFTWKTGGSRFNCRVLGCRCALVRSPILWQNSRPLIQVSIGGLANITSWYQLSKYQYYQTVLVKPYFRVNRLFCISKLVDYRRLDPSTKVAKSVFIYFSITYPTSIYPSHSKKKPVIDLSWKIQIRKTVWLVGIKL